MLDYSASDGKYKLWTVAKPPRPGCPGVAWPPAASGTLAVTRHAMAALPGHAGADGFALLDYDPTSGDYRLGSCNRSQTSKAGHLDCKTSANGTWHTGGLQLLWVGGKTLMRYSRLTGQYSLWGYSGGGRPPPPGPRAPGPRAPRPASPLTPRRSPRARSSCVTASGCAAPC